MIKLVVVGKIKEKALKSLIDEYILRITNFSKIKLIEVNDEPIFKNGNDALNNKVKDTEGENILKQLDDSEFVYLLDLHGKSISSEALAKHIDQTLIKNSKLTFVIGGSLGLSEKVIDRANFRWKLSDNTFPHQLVRLLVVEQIYRCFTINNNLPYHK